jgi:hypothetical protein
VAVFALLNGYLLSQSKPPLGWLNLWLYEASLHKEGLNDIIQGNAYHCDVDLLQDSTARRYHEIYSNLLLSLHTLAAS